MKEEETEYGGGGDKEYGGGEWTEFSPLRKKKRLFGSCACVSEIYHIFCLYYVVKSITGEQW